MAVIANSECLGTPNSDGPFRLDWLEPTRFVVKIAQVVVHEGDEPDVVVDLPYTHLLSRKDQAQIDLAALEADPAAVGDGDRPIVKRVVELAEATVDPLSWLAEIGRDSHVERQVRALLVVLLDESIEARLLLQESTRWRRGSVVNRSDGVTQE